MREEHGEVLLGWRLRLVGGDGGWRVRGSSTPQREPERSDKIVVLDGGGGGRGREEAAGCSPDIVHYYFQSLRRLE